MTTIAFVVLGEPATQGSFRPVSGRVVKADNPRLKPWRNDIAWAAKAARPRGFALIAGPVRLRAAFRVGGRRKDLDKMLRALMDALKGVVYLDDCQVVHAVVSVGPADHEPAGVSVEVTG